MSVAEQEALFERTRRRIQQNLQEISALAERSTGGDAFFPQFVRLAVDSLGGVGGAVWHIKGDSLECVANHNFASIGFQENRTQKRSVEHVLAEVAKVGRSHIVPPGGRGGNEEINATSFPIFYTPVVSDGKVVLILQVWIPDNGDPKTYHDINAFLHSWCQHALTYLRNHHRTALAGKNEELAQLVRMQSELLGELDVREVSTVTVNYTADALRADLAALFIRHGRGWRLLAASNQDAVDQKSQQTRALSALVGELGPAETASTRRAGEGDESGQFTGTDFQSVVWKTIHSSRKHPDYTLVAFRHESPDFDKTSADTLERITSAAGRSIETAHHFHSMPLRQVTARVGRWIHDWKCRRRGRLLAVAGILLALLGALFLIPVPIKVPAVCVVEPTRLSAAVAETSGKVVEVLVREGQSVRAGDVLARLDDREYVTQLAVLEQQRLRWEVEGLRAQTAGSEAERKLADVNIQRETEAMRRVEYLRSKTEIRAAIDGVVLTKNLQNRLGETLEQGARFCELAGDDAYDLVLEIRQSDIGDLLRALETQKSLPVNFILHSHSQYQLSATIDDVRKVSELPELRHDHSAFLLRIPFPEGSPLSEVLKPGYTGKAKVRIGNGSLFHSWFRPFFNYWRVEWGV